MTNALKIVLNCCQLRAISKFQNRLSSVFCFNDQTLKELTSGVHCVKRVRIRRYSISLPYSVRMRENAGKIRTRITPNMDTFYAVVEFKSQCGLLNETYYGKTLGC